MKILVLNVDRDDDFGRKAKIKSPIVGIKDNINAANKLAMADPEDSDVNAIFSAISTYNKYKKEGKEVEIATICGHMNVGLKSDEVLSYQLEEVLAKTQANGVVFVTDGAEDEYILPIIESRVKIISKKRVTVKQSKELEDTYYRVLKLLDDDKVQRQFLLPIALVLIVYAFFVLMGMAASGFGAILLTLGAYLLIRVYRWERNIAFIWDEIKSGFLTGKLSLYTSILGIAIIVISIFLTYDQYNNTVFSSNFEFIQIIFFLQNMIWGIVLAGLVILLGRVVDTYVRDKKIPWNYWVAPFSLFAFGFISYAVLSALYKSLINWPANFEVEPFFTIDFIGYTTTGIMIALVGAITYHYIREIYNNQDKEFEIEKQTQQLVEKN